MIGSIIGDIVGSRFEFKKEKPSKNFDFITEECKFTDDTVLTIATMDVILNNKSYKDAYYEWGNKYPNAGYGNMFSNWLKSDNPQPYNSYGNGSAMRVSPIAYYFNNLKQIIEETIKSAECTHNHEYGINGAVATSLAIYLAKNNSSKKIIKEIVSEYCEYNLDKNFEKIKNNYAFDVTCQGSVPESIITFLYSNGYEDCIRNIITLGGDTDTQACIAGGIYEAYNDQDIRVNNEKCIKILKDKLPKEMYDILAQFYVKIKNPIGCLFH